MEEKIIQQPSDFTKTIGAQIQDHLNKGLTQEDDLRTYSEVIMSKMMQELNQFKEEVVKSGKYDSKDFYLVVSLGKNPMTKQLQYRFLPERSTPPTPCFRDHVWRYDWISGELKFLWRIPDKDRYEHVLKYWQNYRNSHKKDHRDLALWVKEIESGRLLQLINKMCGNKKNAVISLTPKDSER